MSFTRDDAQKRLSMNSQKLRVSASTQVRGSKPRPRRPFEAPAQPTVGLPGLYINSQDRCRDLRGPNQTRHPPGTGTIRKSLSLERSSSGSTDLKSSGAGISRSSPRRGVGGTGGGAGSPALEGRDLTAARSGWPCGITAPHAVHVLPLWLTASHTGQRQTLMAGFGSCVSAPACRRVGPEGAVRCPAVVAPRCVTPCLEGPMVEEEVSPRPPAP